VKKDALEKLARDIATMAYNASGAVLVGNAPPCVHELRKRFEDIKIGDLVVETTTALMDGRRGEKYFRPALDAVGYLVKVTWEPIVWEGDPDFVWDEVVEGKPHPTEKCTYIQTLDGREFRWTNASFVSAPNEWPMRKASTVPNGPRGGAA
jgi:hypothetical protein